METAAGTDAVALADLLEEYDPIDKLRAIAARQRAELVDPAPLRAAFVAVAKGWADAERIPVTAFQAMAVPDNVLHEAGFEVLAPRRRRAASRRQAGAGGRRTGLGVAQVRTWVLEHAPAVFTVLDATEGSGASAAAARRAITELVDAGDLTRLGPAPDWNRPGRAPVRYARPATEAAA